MPEYNQTVHVNIPGSGVGLEARTPIDAAVIGVSEKWVGVYGESKGGFGVKGVSVETGVVGESATWYGVYGASKGNGNKGAAAVYALGDYTYGESAAAIGLYAKAPTWAGVFEGQVKITSYLEIPNGIQVFSSPYTSHCAYFPRSIKVDGQVRGTGGYAEMFNVEADAEFQPGAVLVIGENGLLDHCDGEFDTRVVGVVLGDERIPGTVSGRAAKSEQEGEEESSHQVPVAMAGQVSVLADAKYGEISPGDLLTTSPTSGHAMLVKDRARASGAIIGKALSSLDKETGLVRMLVMAT